MERDCYFTAEQAREYGLIDRLTNGHWRRARGVG